MMLLPDPCPDPSPGFFGLSFAPYVVLEISLVVTTENYIPLIGFYR